MGAGTGAPPFALEGQLAMWAVLYPIDVSLYHWVSLELDLYLIVWIGWIASSGFDWIIMAGRGHLVIARMGRMGRMGMMGMMDWMGCWWDWGGTDGC